MNDAPVFAHFGTNHSTGTEQTFSIINSAATINDVDLDALNGGAGNYAGASLIVGRTVANNPEDTFSFSPNNSPAFTVDNVNHTLLAGGQQFATFSIPASGAQQGTISINFNSLNTVATTTLVNNVLEHISYKNLSDNPPANVTMHFTFNDGNIGGAQGTGGQLSDTANRIIDITAVDDAPVATNGSVSGNEDTAINGQVPAATDVDNTAAQLTYSLVGTNGGAAHGTVVLNAADGTFTYTPAANFNGSDSFSFKANDGTLDSNTVTESVAVVPVNDAPVATNGSVSGNEDTVIGGQVPTASDIDNSAAQLSYSLVGTNGGAAHGTVVLNADGTFSYTPNANFNGSDSFSFKANDGALDSNTATEAVTVAPVNDAPVAVNGSTSGNEDTIIAGILPAGSDVDNTPAQLTFALVGSNGGAAHGTVTLDAATGNFIYTPVADFNGSDSFSFRISDGALNSNTATESLSVANVNDAPVINSNGGGATAIVSVAEHISAVTTVHATDINSPTVTYSIAGGADAGQFQINPTTGGLSFITAPSFATPTDANGDNAYIVQVRASDGSLTDDQTLTVNITHGLSSRLDAGFHGDFGGDHKADLLLLGSDGTVTLDQMNGATIASSTGLGHVGTEWHVESVADFDGNGTADVLWHSDTGTLASWSMNGSQIAANNNLGIVGNEWHINGTADFGGDGKADILWRGDNGSIALWQMNGSQIAANNTIGSVGAEWHVEALADFDGDHKADILWRSDSGALALWQMNGSQITTNSSLGTVGNEWHVVGSGDFNADGKNDILWRADDGTIALWQMNGSQVIANNAIGTVGPEWHVEGTGDFNGDGKTDIVWRQTDGTTALWTMDGAHILANATIAALPADTLLGVHHYDLV